MIDVTVLACAFTAGMVSHHLHLLLLLQKLLKLSHIILMLSKYRTYSQRRIQRIHQLYPQVGTMYFATVMQTASNSMETSFSHLHFHVAMRKTGASTVIHPLLEPTSPSKKMQSESESYLLRRESFVMQLHL